MPRLSNKRFDESVRLAKLSGIPIDTCPTCLTTARERAYEIGNEHSEPVIGTYRYRGVGYVCDCEDQIILRRHYLLAGIGEQYMRLDWADFRGSEDAKDAVDVFLNRWDSFKVNGMGVEFSSPNLGVGKTFAATHLGKELIKRGERVWFTPFTSAVRTLISGDDDAVRALRDSTVLILDEVGGALSEAQADLFSVQFEDLIRNRTNFNRVTIMTTNLTPNELHQKYPRTYSLLEAKQMRIEMNGEDARQSFIANENIELAANGEVRPIT